MESIPSSNPEQKPQKHELGSVGWGAILIFIGAFILAQQMGWLGTNFNWWAIFIFIPVYGSFAEAVALYRKSGRVSAGVRSSIGSGLVILTVALMLMFGVDWRTWWPLMVIMPGFSILLGGIEGQTSDGSTVRELISMAFWIGLGVMYVGAGFLLKNLGMADGISLLAFNRWWAVAILIPAAGAIINALWITVRQRRITGAATGLIIFGMIAAAVGLVALLGVNWNILGPVMLILVGIGVLLGIFTK